VIFRFEEESGIGGEPKGFFGKAIKTVMHNFFPSEMAKRTPAPEST